MQKYPKRLTDKLEYIPKKPGVYCFKDKNSKVIYVGKAKVLRNRVRSYFHDSHSFDPKTVAMLNRADDVEVIVTDNEVEALILEANLVKENKPRYNIDLRDDKSYPHIRVTNEPYPRVFPTRKIVRDGSKYFGPYTDTKSMRATLRIIGKVFPIRSCKYHLTEETIKKGKIKVCLDYHIKKCEAPCEGLISQSDYSKIVEGTVQFLQGKNTRLIQSLTKEMECAAERKDFEEAAMLRDKINTLESFYSSRNVDLEKETDIDVFSVAHEDTLACAVVFKIREGKIIGRQHFYLDRTEHRPEPEILKSFLQQYYLQSGNENIPDEVFLPCEPEDFETVCLWLKQNSGHRCKVRIPRIGPKLRLVDMAKRNAQLMLEELKLQKMKAGDYIPHSLKELAKDLRLHMPPRRIEAFDISNLAGKDAVASMVCFQDGSSHKSEYRRYKIKTLKGPDDFGMIAEAVTRRYRRLLEERKPLPDLILVDGGKGQLSAAMDALKNLGIHNQPVCALAKRFEEVYLPSEPGPISIAKTSSSLRLLQRVRDESHRFALLYHRKRRTSRTLTSELDSIPGIGKARRQAMLNHFGSLKKLKQASEKEIAKVRGLSIKIAHQVYSALHEKIKIS